MSIGDRWSVSKVDEGACLLCSQVAFLVACETQRLDVSLTILNKSVGC